MIHERGEKQVLYRIIDVNINRAREGLRVVEEIARFVLEDNSLRERIKSVRHEISRTSELFGCNAETVPLSRDADSDIGRNEYTSGEQKRSDICDILNANLRRVEESLRVLEEFSKLTNGDAGKKFKELRYETYSIETAAIKKLLDA